jgi:NADH-quinone oxidoreductase subunit G
MTDTVNIEIDGKKIQAEPGSLIIEASDAHNVYIPRFCYHKKLSVAANCRMCLVEVEGSRKALPACATPISEGMKVKTRSELARKAQKAVMEFLLINHPLDCPICDQGGQCELQDVAMGYGGDASEYTSTKRVVQDQNLGPLINTDMTRCIHCTRCVRFGKEITGEPELGTVGRGEHTMIGTYVEKAIRSELSGNVIDVCPVGALTSKPFRYTARAWELQQRASIAGHDCLGSNINVHSVHDTVKRVVPRENEEINEVWLSDRDRFAYEGVNSEQRLTKPLLKKDGQWQEIDWTTALEITASSLENVKNSHGVEQIGGLISPNSTTEEHYLFQKVLRDFGSNNIDHRLKHSDFSDQDSLPVFPRLGVSIADIEKQDAVLLICSDVQREQPLLIARLLKVSRNGGSVMTANVFDINGHFMSSKRIIAAPENLIRRLAGLVKALGKGKTLPAEAQRLVADVELDADIEEVASTLLKANNGAIIIGAIAQNSQYSSIYRYLGQLIAELSNASYGILSQGANSAGACLAGSLPHRTVAGGKVTCGDNAKQMLEQGKKAYLLFNTELEYDSANAKLALTNLRAADFVVSFSPFVTDTMQSYADLILPIVPYTETPGTFVNCNGLWQNFTAAVTPLGEARPGWKVLRVLGNFLDLKGFDYVTCNDVSEELKQATSSMADLERPAYAPAALPAFSGLRRIGIWPLYRTDNVVRRSEPLQQMLNAGEFGARINQATADSLQLKAGDRVHVNQGDAEFDLPVIIDNRGVTDCVYITAGVVGSEQLGAVSSTVELRKKA